ncbi:MAG TPA: hypothetical protein VEL31_11555 [Ktedonobacteraceae bacterium]|nr:hypothetical protein [Ktedonobacteraceae bacterium]
MKVLFVGLGNLGSQVFDLFLEDGQRFDGIEKIESDGTVYFMEKNMAILKDILDYDCRRMPLSEGEGWAKELQTKYRALASKYR